jgi:SAM-dependent methyltransferase
MSDYAEIPYESLPIPDSHPERLEALGHLFGLSPADPVRCRVLELGCAGGGNLIPLAFWFPQSRFLGVDLYANQVAEGQALVEAAGLGNIELRQGDILDLDASALGTFDYVIVHGVYSWVPDAVRERILSLCAAVLAADGIAYISYNTLPGWRMRGILRDILGYAARRAHTAQEQVIALGGCLDRMERAVAGLDAASARYLAAEIARLRARPASYVVHEYLERENRPMLLSDFVSAAQAAGLRYLCDTDLQTRYPEVVGTDVAEALADLRGPLEREQYLDFVVNRNFRRSLLCSAAARPTDEPQVALLEGMQFAASLAPPKKLDLRRVRAAPFHQADGGTVEVHHPLTKAALLHLARQHPGSLALPELAELAGRDVVAAGGGALAGDHGHLVSELFSLVVLGAAELLRRGRAIPGASGYAPVASALALAQLQLGSRRLTTRLHGILAVDELAARVLGLLDGRRGVDQVVECLVADLSEGRLDLDGVPSSSAREPRTGELLRRNVERLLDRFTRSGLVVAESEHAYINK